jgi:tight adherence protein B
MSSGVGGQGHLLTLIAGTAAAFAVLLASGSPRWDRGATTRPMRGMRPLTSLAWVIAVIVLVIAGPGQITGSRAVLAAIAAVAGASVLGLVRRQRLARKEADAADRVVEMTDLLVAELAAGLPPGQALAHAAESWPDLLPVVEADRLGADVPEALRTLAALPGRHDLRLVGAAWEVALRTGGGLAEPLARIAAGIRANRVTARIVGSELASARATARLVAVLPGAALLMGTSDDARPVAFLLTEPWGLACLASGLACGLAGLWWIEAIARRVVR